MKTAILNFLATRLGAWLAPVISGAIASGFAWLGQHIPWGVGAFLSTPESQTAIIGAVFGAIMVAINGVTTTRAVKYTKPLQTFVNVLARHFGIPSIPVDGVAGPVTASVAQVALGSASISLAQAKGEVMDQLPHETPASAIAGNPTRKG